MSGNEKHQCRCGAVHATAAGYRSMSSSERSDFNRRLRNCQTCRLDSQHRRDPRFHHPGEGRGGASGGEA